MKLWKFLIGGAVLLLFSGYEFESYKDYRTPPYEGVFTWTQVTKKSRMAQSLGSHFSLFRRSVMDHVWL